MSDNKQHNPAKSLRHRARELAMQGIYEWRLSGKSPSLIAQGTLAEKSIGRYDTEFFGLLLKGAHCPARSIVRADCTASGPGGERIESGRIFRVAAGRI